MTTSASSLLSSADMTYADDRGPIQMSLTRLKTTRSAVRSRPCPTALGQLSGRSDGLPSPEDLPDGPSLDHPFAGRVHRSLALGNRTRRGAVVRSQALHART